MNLKNIRNKLLPQFEHKFDMVFAGHHQRINGFNDTKEFKIFLTEEPSADYKAEIRFDLTD